MLNFIGWLNASLVAPCSKASSTQDQCFSTHNSTYYAQDDISQTWRSWPYQYCTQWGFFQTGSGVPADQLPLISRTLTLEYESIICRDAFNITTPPDTEAVNKYGGFGIAYDRLAFVNGEADPWRPATPASPQAPNPNRTSTIDMPFVVISGAVHHWVSSLHSCCCRRFLVCIRMRTDCSRTRRLQLCHQRLWLTRRRWKYSGCKHGWKNGNSTTSTQVLASNQSEF